MAQRRKIEVFTAGCPCCTEAVELVKFLAGTEHDVEIRDMHDDAVAVAASGYGILRVPAVVIDGQLVDYIAGFGPNEASLTQAIFGTARRAAVGGRVRGSRDRVPGAKRGQW